MSKIKCIIYSPIDTYSGYGSCGRDRAKAIIELYGNEWNIQILSCRWGGTPQGFIRDNFEEWGFLEKYIIPDNSIHYKPDIMIWHTIPSEFNNIGKFNIGMTAGIETSLSSTSFLEGLNKMDLNIVPSNHSKKTFELSKYDKINEKTKEIEGGLSLTKPCEVVFEGANTDVYRSLTDKEFTNKELYRTIGGIKEKFAFLFTGLWGAGDLGEDRKNVGLLIKAFYETFKLTNNPPALILKTSLMNSSYMDREAVLKRIEKIKKTCGTKNLPNVYLLSGEFSDIEMNEIYNHPKVKAMVSLTKGEGFGRPLLEFTLSKKIIMASGWSGQVDFLKPDLSAMVGGQLGLVHPSAANEWLLKESQWFQPDHGQIQFFLKDIFSNYNKYVIKGKQQGFHSKTNFSYEKMKERIKEVFDQYLPVFPKEMTLNIPHNITKIELPKLQKIESNG